MRRFTTSVSEITYAGIDFHKRFIMVALGDSNGELVRHEKIFNDEETIRNFFAQFPGIVCAIETCRGFEWLLDLLQGMRIQVKVCHAAKLKLIAQTAFKTDKIDSQVIMKLLAKDFLPIVHFPSKAQQQIKERLRWRVHLMRTSSRIKLRIHALIDKENKGLQCKDPFTVQGRKYLQTVALEPDRRRLLDRHLELLDEIQKRLDDELKWLKELVASNPNTKLLLTVPGIGTISAATIATELGDVTRFRSAQQVSKYLGLVPKENSSGDKQKMGRISKEGNSHVRWLLIQDAWQAIHKSPALWNLYMRISVRRGAYGKQIAIVAVARRLAEISFNVLRHGQPYSESRVSLGQRVGYTNAESVDL